MIKKIALITLTLCQLPPDLCGQLRVITAGDAVESADLARLQQSFRIPPGGELISPEQLPQEYLADRKHSHGFFKRRDVAGAPGRSIVETAITSTPQAPWGVQIIQQINTPLKRGETLFVSLIARTLSSEDETGDGKFTVFAQLSRAPYEKFLYTAVDVGHTWKRIHYPFKVDRDYAVGEAQFGLMLGHRVQTIQIAELLLYNYGAGKSIGELPITSATYRGQAEDAPWRAAAAERIDALRKTELKVVVKDVNGQALEHAKVHAVMQRHAFHFGSAVDAQLLMQQSADGERYRSVVEKYFTIAVFENDLKWPSWESVKRREVTLQALAWLEERAIAVRGHCLVWPSWKNTPRDLESLKDNPAALAKRVRDHILEQTTPLKGRIYEWDVINEPYSNHDLMDLLGRQSMIDWFKLAHQGDPQARLFLNDYSILSAGGLDTKHQDHFENTIRYLIDGGAPISGIGVQSHFGGDVTPPDVVYNILERYSKFNLPVAVTEHDIDTHDKVLQSNYTRDFMTIAFSHPKVESFLVWGFWEKRHWRPASAYYDKDWKLTPAGEAWLNLMTNTWWSDEKMVTDKLGVASCRVFLGDYTINVTHNNQVVTQDISLNKLNNEFTVVFKW
ncbi:MAG: endo-1,4-beta-xylanase [Kiritimatiellae bacterium]|nr:endo-1,4-beta-xylanase [Kiritimatiellia bacterium]